MYIHKNSAFLSIIFYMLITQKISASGGLFINYLNGIIKAFECLWPPWKLKSGGGTPRGKGTAERGGPVNPLTHGTADVLTLQPSQVLPKDLWGGKLWAGLWAPAVSHTRKNHLSKSVVYTEDDLEECKHFLLLFLTVNLFCSCK